MVNESSTQEIRYPGKAAQITEAHSNENALKKDSFFVCALIKAPNIESNYNKSKFVNL